jgi:hypothetical protein
MRGLLSGRAVLAGTFVLALLASACSGNKPATNVAANGPDATASAPESPGAKPATKAGGGGSSSGGGTTSSVGGGGGSTPARNVAGTRQKTRSGFSYKAANLFTPSRDRIGITATQLNLCMHAALVLGPAFNDSAKDFQVYWQWLNDHGGVFGRKVNMVFTDDAYTPSGGVQAAQQCYSNNPQPFLMMAGVGFDTVPAVRQWA